MKTDKKAKNLPEKLSVGAVCGGCRRILVGNLRDFYFCDDCDVTSKEPCQIVIGDNRYLSTNSKDSIKLCGE